MTEQLETGALNTVGGPAPDLQERYDLAQRRALSDLNANYVRPPTPEQLRLIEAAQERKTREQAEWLERERLEKQATRDDQLRAASLEAALRIADPGVAAPIVLASAKAFEAFLRGEAA